MRFFSAKVCLISLVSCAGLLFSGCDFINSLLPGSKPKNSDSKTPTPTTKATKSEAAPAGRVLAQVGSWTLTVDQFNQRIKLLKEGLPNFDENKPGNKEAVLDELVRQQLLVQDAEESGIGQQKEIAEAVDDFRRTLLVQELANRLAKNVSATEKDAQDYYNENKEMFVEPVQWKVREIVVADEATAKNILVQLLQGGNFAETAKSQSKGKTAAKGGLLAPFVKAPFPTMQNALSTLDSGGTSGVFKGPEGHYIVHVDEKKGGKARAFADVKADLISGLTLKKQQDAILAHIQKLQNKTTVQINKELLGPKTK